jgi:hypothetical protein
MPYYAAQDNGRDKIGNDRPDCELNRIPANSSTVLARPNATTPASIPNFGHPYCHTEGEGDPYVRGFGAGLPLPDPEFNPNNTVVNCSGTCMKHRNSIQLDKSA